jgi:hypothetical protein
LNNPVIKKFEGVNGDIEIRAYNVIRPRLTFSASVYEHLLRISNDTDISLSTIIQLAIKNPCASCGATEINLPIDLSKKNLSKSIHKDKMFKKNSP